MRERVSERVREKEQRAHTHLAHPLLLSPMEWKIRADRLQIDMLEAARAGRESDVARLLTLDPSCSLAPGCDKRP